MNLLRKLNCLFHYYPKSAPFSSLISSFTTHQLTLTTFPPDSQIILTTLCSNGQLKEALIEMAAPGLEMKFESYDMLLNACIKKRAFREGQRVHAHMIKTRYLAPVYLRNRLIIFYSKCDRLREARNVLDEMPEKNVVSWTAMISAYSQRGFATEALDLFLEMLRSALDLGKQVHNHVLRCKLPFYVVLQNSLIDMYSKCGNLIYSRRIFDNMPERTVISWNAMLVGYSKHGMGREVVELYKLMRNENKIKPDSVTLLGVLSGCSHGGMENVGLEIFEEMVNGKDGVEPDIEHYGCVVDLLGRAGRVEEAFEFIKKMPFEPTAALWGSLLGACRVHSNIDIGEFVGHRLLEIEPENAGNYVILSNLYASTGRWEDVRMVRDLMLKKAVKKEPGKSWIELDQTHHSFHASDRSHPRREEVFAKMKELSIKFKEAGYVPDLSCVLHDVDEEQKEKILLGHSEKLALTFGLISTSDRAPLRVIKNLRICVDCHNFAKFVSKIYMREVYLRDKNRFHHISMGVCSCGDYW
ncbi:hypothetical protein ES319_A09G133100v1 [Gossypium barbadense]|uniref:DYW domain-containing protein n=1 Tax=Gossypium barbadense TaxID=3634 RepID=A0A5J5UE54_GOSBA|nr:hypothetical protein ES319_A09G133100v1 [Gossypium barbadense]